MAKNNNNGQLRKFEETLWKTANHLRGSVESAEYKHVVLSLIFLKFASDKFEQRRQKLLASPKTKKFVDQVEFYARDNVFYLPQKARWEHIQKHAKQPDIAGKIDAALSIIEKENKPLRGALPEGYFSRLALDTERLSALIDAINNLDTIADRAQDIVGRVYEYFLRKFAAKEGTRGGEFYTPGCVVRLIVEMIEPFKGRIYDPCCGSGGMFVQSLKFVESHEGNYRHISVYGQELTTATYKLAKMNLAIRGITANFGDKPADTFINDQHPNLKADYIMANPPFDQSDWRADDALTDDPRWSGYTTPPTGNANYAWILHILSKLSEDGVAGFVMANGSMSTSRSEQAIRQRLIESDHIDCMVALPGQLFYTTQIPACLWFLTKNKSGKHGHRARRGETLFIDARKMGALVGRVQRELSAEEIAEIARTYHAWRGEKKDGKYKDIPGFCKTVATKEIEKHDFVLTPGRYVGTEVTKDDGALFEEKMWTLTKILHEKMRESARLDKVIRGNLKYLDYGE